MKKLKQLLFAPCNDGPSGIEVLGGCILQLGAWALILMMSRYV